MTRHSWDHNNPKRFPACESPDGNGRTERYCLNEGCGLVKITAVSSEAAWWEWRTPDGYSWRGQTEPPCAGKPAPTQPQIAASSKAEVVAV